MSDLYYSLQKNAKDIDNVLVDLIETRDNDQAGRAIGIIEKDGNKDDRHIGTLDNIVTKTNIYLSPPLKEYEGETDEANGKQELTLLHLLENGTTYRIVNRIETNGKKELRKINKINIADISKMDYFQKQDQNNNEENIIDTTYDYYCTFIFKRGDNLDEPIELMGNFDDGEESIKDNPYPIIKLLNPDLDISEYEIIHLLLFHDSENMCALVMGY